jgi:hypothetical protein
MGKISGPCKAAAKKKFEVWPSAYASGWGVRCTKSVVAELKKASRMHAAQAKKIEGHIKAMQQMSKKKK